MNYQSDSNRNSRRGRPTEGFTVVELLVVMAVIVVLAAVTLPTVKALLSGQKTTEAARLVKAMASSAKSRAIATGRPVALILDRSHYDGSAGLVGNNTCTRLSLGDVFPPYSGDWAGASGTITDDNNDGFADHIDIPLAQVASLIDPSTSQPTGLVQPGDLMELGPRRERFFITLLERPASTALVRIWFNNPARTTGGVPMLEQALPVGSGGSRAGITFRIYRKPTKSLAGGVSLPRGTCIDMHFSGFGPTGRQFSSDIIHFTADPSNTPTYPPSTVNDNSNYGPVYLVFSPTGQVSAWYFQNRAASSANPVQQRGYPTGLIHMLVGTTDQVPEVSPLQDPATATIVTEEYTPNIMDSENSWVTINPYTGGITTSTVQSTTVGGTPTTLDARVAQARSLATNALSEPTQ